MIYFITCETSDLIKVGLADDVRARLSGLQVGSPFRLEVLATFAGGRALEKQLHAAFADCRRIGEWFDGHVVREFLEKAASLGFGAALVEALDARDAAKAIRKERANQFRRRFAQYLADSGLDTGKRRLTAEDFLNHSHRMGVEFTNGWLAIFGYEVTEAPMCRDAADELIRVVTPLSSAGKAA